MEERYCLPCENVNDQEAVIGDVNFESGAEVRTDDVLYTFETTKSVVDVTSEVNGFVFYAVEPGERVRVGDLVCVVTKDKAFDIKSQTQKKNTTDADGSAEYTLTKKAKALVDKHNMDVSKYSFSGIIRERDILDILKQQDMSSVIETPCIVTLDVSDPLVQRALSDPSIRDLSSDEKIEMYRRAGHAIGDNVEIRKGAILIGNSIEIGNHVVIDTDVYIESPHISIQEHTSIGPQSHFVASSINIGAYNKIALNVTIDISGGRYPDSDFSSGLGCLLAGGVYVNVCRAVRLGDHVALSPRSMIFTHSYWQSVLDGYPAVFGPVLIEDNAWIGALSQILPLVSIGTGSIVMSGSLVSSSVEAFTMVGGTPAQIIKKNIKKDLSHQQVTARLLGLMQECAEYISMTGRKVEKENMGAFKIYDKTEVRSLSFIDGNQEPKDSSWDLVVLLNPLPSIQTKARTAFVIKTKEAIGETGPLENIIKDFFRRRGIIFYSSDSQQG